jgi:hypothetical protein
MRIRADRDQMVILICQVALIVVIVLRDLGVISSGVSNAVLVMLGVTCLVVLVSVLLTHSAVFRRIGVVALVLVSLTASVLLAWRENMFSDLFLNFLVEGIGMVVGVAFVDYWIKRREEERWQPARNLVYAKLVDIVDELYSLLPSHRLDSCTIRIHFGHAVTHLRCVQRELRSFWEVHAAVENRYAASDKLREKLSDGAFDMLSEAKGQLDNTIDAGAFVLDPETLGLAMKLARRIEWVLSMGKDYPAETRRMLFVGGVAQVLWAACELQQWFEAKADRQVTRDEERKELEEELAAQERASLGEDASGEVAQQANDR